MFQNCANLTEFSIPEFVTSLGTGVFYATSLTTIKLPSNMTVIGEGAFCRCENLVEVIFNQVITTIGSIAFGVCTALDR
jgi:hypothetical protein